MIDLVGNKGYIAYNLRNKGIPESEIEDLYQDCCVVYYRNPSTYKSKYGDIHIMDLLMKRVLSERARYFRCSGRNSTMESFEVDLHDTPVTSKAEQSVDVARLYSKLSPLFKTLLNTRKTVKIIAKEEGVHRQVIERRLKEDMSEVKRIYGESYA